MKIEQQDNYLEIKREFGDSSFRQSRNSWGDGESRLLYYIKRCLNDDPSLVSQPPGTQFIKKRMWKDGHLVSTQQQYIRTAKPNKITGLYLCFYNNNWAVRGLDDDFREYGVASLVGEWISVDKLHRKVR